MYLRPFISKLFYAVLLSSLWPKHNHVVQHPATRVQKRAGYRRTMSTVNSLIPGIASQFSHWMHKNNSFPWQPVDMELIAFGSGTAAFKIDWEAGSKVLRIYRRSLGKSAQGLLEIAEYYKKNYLALLSWYSDVPGLVLPMEFMVLEGLPLIGPVAASLQPYVPGRKKDLFEDFSDADLLALLRENGSVREQFLCFARQTIGQWEEQEMCYDFLGRGNVILVKHGGTYRLHIIDVGIFKFEVVLNKYPDKMPQIEKRIHRLTSLYKQAKGI